MWPKVKSYLSKINFLLGNSPKIERNEHWRKFIPPPYKAVVTITADFELAWAWRYSKSVKNPLTRALQKAKLERENIPKILELCDKYEIPITWATVGHLFLESCNLEYTKPHSNLPRLNHFENNYWRYRGKDWYEYDPCSNYKKAPAWYSPDLIEHILNSKVKHEIGCHTFSHIECGDEICPPEVFESEIKECIKSSAKFGVELKSFVHPGHTIGNLKKLSELGFTSFQTDPGNILGYPVKNKNGLWELKRTYEFVYRESWSVNYHIYRYRKIIDRAIENNSVCNFWFHPSMDKNFLIHVLPTIFKYLYSKKMDVAFFTCGSYVQSLRLV